MANIEHTAHGAEQAQNAVLQPWNKKMGMDHTGLEAKIKKHHALEVPGTRRPNRQLA